MSGKKITELNIVGLNRELSARGIETGGTKADKILVLEEYIRTRENRDPGTVIFETDDERSSTEIPAVTQEALYDTGAVKTDNNLMHTYMEQVLDRLENLEATVDEQQRTIGVLSESVERLERELSEEKRKSAERVVETTQENLPRPYNNVLSGTMQNCPDKNLQATAEDRWSNIRNRLSGGNPPRRVSSGVSGETPGASGEMSGVSGEMSGVFGNLSGVSGVSGGISGGKRVHFAESLLIPQHELSLARTSIPEFAGKKDEDPERFLLQAEEILVETGINRARWVTVLAPQLKGKAGTWWGRLRSLDLPWAQFKDELLRKFNGDDLQSGLQSELLSISQTRSETLEEFILMKYQLYLRVNEGLAEQAVVRTVIGLMREEFRVHARIQRPRSFAELRDLSYVLDGCITVAPGRSESTPNNGQAKPNWREKKKPEVAEKSKGPTSSHRLSAGPGCRLCGDLDHWQAACPNKKSESGNARTTGGTGGSRPVRR